jgi:hypothetical protein
MATYATCQPWVLNGLSAVVKNYHPHLAELGVTFTCLFAHAPVNESTGDPRGRPLKVGGVEVDVKIRPVGLKDRVAGAKDCEILLDGDAGKDWTVQELSARLDHALHQIEVVSDDDGHPVADDCGRPKLKRRPFDFAACGFWPVVERYGDSAPEAAAARLVGERIQEITRQIADVAMADRQAANGAA